MMAMHNKHVKTKEFRSHSSKWNVYGPKLTRQTDSGLVNISFLYPFSLTTQNNYECVVKCTKTAKETKQRKPMQTTTKTNNDAA
uniref:Uncharacterized protein n=1 Tax=Rhizophora mucronata TaxID=61149 RepID=A0A2P2QHQ5_RHIMU